MQLVPNSIPFDLVSRKEPGVNLRKNTGRTLKSHFEHTKEGPHENRFALDDDFDKSMRLTRNPNKMHTLEFKRQVERRQDSVLKAGDVTIDLAGRTDSTYDGVERKAHFTMPRLDKGVCDQAKQTARSDKHRFLEESNQVDSLKAQATYLGNVFTRVGAQTQMEKTSPRKFTDLLTTEQFFIIEEENKQQDKMKQMCRV